MRAAMTHAAMKCSDVRNFAVAHGRESDIMLISADVPLTPYSVSQDHLILARIFFLLSGRRDERVQSRLDPLRAALRSKNELCEISTIQEIGEEEVGEGHAREMSGNYRLMSYKLSLF